MASFNKRISTKTASCEDRQEKSAVIMMSVIFLSLMYMYLNMT